MTASKQIEAMKLALQGAANYIDALGGDSRKYRQALAEQPAQPSKHAAGWDSIEAMAAERYKVVPSHDSMFYRHAVVAGNGTQQLYVGRELECENMARKFAGAFLDGAFVMQGQTFQPAQRKPLTITEESAWDLARYVYARSNPHESPQILLSAMEIKQIIEAANGITGEKK